MCVRVIEEREYKKKALDNNSVPVVPALSSLNFQINTIVEKIVINKVFVWN